MPQTHGSTATASPLSLVALLFVLHDMLPAHRRSTGPSFAARRPGGSLAERCCPTLVGHRKHRLENRHARPRLVVADRLGQPGLPDDGGQQRRIGDARARACTSAATVRSRVAVQLDYRVLCLDLASGKMLWERTVHRGPAEQPDSREEQLRLGDARDRWRARLRLFRQPGPVLSRSGRARRCGRGRSRPHATRNGWGTAASPVLHGDRLYIVNDNDEESYLLASTSTPARNVARCPRREEQLVHAFHLAERPAHGDRHPGTGKVRAYDLEGKLLWWFAGMSSITIATPYADQGCCTSVRATSATTSARSTRSGPAHPATFRLQPARPATSSSPGASPRPRPTTRRRSSTTDACTCSTTAA